MSLQKYVQLVSTVEDEHGTDEAERHVNVRAISMVLALVPAEIPERPAHQQERDLPGEVEVGRYDQRQVEEQDVRDVVPLEPDSLLRGAFGHRLLRGREYSVFMVCQYYNRLQTLVVGCRTGSEKLMKKTLRY